MKKILITLFAFMAFLGSVHAAEIGKVTGEATATEINIGYAPSYIRVVNKTTNLAYERFSAMDANETLLTTGSTGVVTVDGTTAIVSGTITDEDGSKFYGFSVKSALNDVLLYEVRR